MYIFSIQKLCNMYTAEVYKMYTRCIQNVSHISTSFVYILYTKLKELRQLNFVYKNMVQTFVEIWDIFCILFVHILRTPILIYKKIYILRTMDIYNLYIKFIQNLYK